MRTNKYFDPHTMLAPARPQQQFDEEQAAKRKAASDRQEAARLRSKADTLEAVGESLANLRAKQDEHREAMGKTLRQNNQFTDYYRERDAESQAARTARLREAADELEANAGDLE